MEKEALIVGTSSGLLLLHSVDGKETEVVGRVDGGVKFISTSPDGDLLGVTTGFGQLLVMTHDWDFLYETALEDHSDRVDVREPEFSSREMFGSPISCRGDGKHFATLSEALNASSSNKRLKVWERDTGTVHASSEPKELMGSDLLAAVVRSGNYDSVKIWFFSNNHCVAELPMRDTCDSLESKEFSVEQCLSEMPVGSFVHLAWLHSHMLLAVSYHRFSHSNCYFQTSSKADSLFGFYLQEIELTCSENSVPGLLTCAGWHAKVSHRNLLEGLVMGITPNPAKKGSAFVQFDGGEVFEHTSKLGINKRDFKHDELRFSSSCPWMKVVLVGATEPSMLLLFGLDDMRRLHVGRKILCSNCSSFSFYSNLGDNVITHLIIATKQDFLFIVDTSDILHGELELTYENFIHSGRKREEEENINFINIWERGAKIVGVLHGDEAAVILQTNRGNLECIYPRKLVLASIDNALNQRSFRDALLMVRRHRIDFNVIADYCGIQVFNQLASEFVKQVDSLVGDPTLADKHQSSDHKRMKWGWAAGDIGGILRDSDSKILGSFSHAVGPGPPPLAELKAIEKGIDFFLSTDWALKGRLIIESDCSWSIEAEGAGKVLLLFKEDANNKVLSVLLAIRRALEKQVSESPSRELCILTTLARSDPPALEEALERVNVIREIELSGSDDPRQVNCPSAEEALKHLLWLSDSEAVFEAALGLYDLNLAAIVALNSQRDPKEFLPFLQELEHMPILLMRYNIDLRLHRISADTDPTRRGQVLDTWGDQMKNALKMLLQLTCLEKNEVMQLAHELYEELQALGKPGEAAKTALEYCGDISAGINLLISARDWEEALRVAFLHSREVLVSLVKNAALECASGLIDEYKEGLEKVGKYLTRYLAVRQRRLLLAAKLQSEERSINDLDDDTASEASSTFSGMMQEKTLLLQLLQLPQLHYSPGEEMALVESHVPNSWSKEGTKVVVVRLSEDTLSDDTINEQAHTLERYLQKMKTVPRDSNAFSWHSRVFLSPRQARGEVYTQAAVHFEMMREVGR
ncbi:IKI3 family protein isoform 4 [Hibiscus syriacus]|uniref:IKI3 family protein isoform 4 n=1 Tax=Hibiscus syriacus TaxID=106335 RepID=A0A6A2X986_HIBSY|nr:IKI3 family protein isoform 4 [Hibiscus syriacus]